MAGVFRFQVRLSVPSEVLSSISGAHAMTSVCRYTVPSSAFLRPRKPISPGPSPSWEDGANVIWLAPLPVPGSGAGELSHGQIWLHLYAQGSWAEGGNASAS